MKQRTKFNILVLDATYMDIYLVKIHKKNNPRCYHCIHRPLKYFITLYKHQYLLCNNTIIAQQTVQ